MKTFLTIFLPAYAVFLVGVLYLNHKLAQRNKAADIEEEFQQWQFDQLKPYNQLERESHWRTR